MMNLIEYNDIINSTILNPNIANSTYTESDLIMYDDLFNSTIAVELERLFIIKNKYQAIGNKIVVNKSLIPFFERVFTASCPRILKKISSEQQIYLLHIFGITLCRYNERKLNIENDKFIQNIFIPNLMTACAKSLINARRLIQKLIRKSYIIIENKSKDIIDFYVELHNQDINIVKHDIIYLFLRNIIIKFDPLSIDDIESFYQSIIQRMFFFYLKAKTSGDMDDDINYLYNDDRNVDIISSRCRIYEEALYLCQIQKMCNESTSAEQISKQYDRMKGIVISNEIQKLYLYSYSKQKYGEQQNKTVMIKTYESLEELETFRYKVPIIYRLLRSIHVISETPTFSQSDIERIKNIIYIILYDKFKDVFADSIVMPIIKKISNNMVASLVEGEFIDMLTLTKIDISGTKFVQQLQIFLEIMLKNVNLDYQ